LSENPGWTAIILAGQRPGEDPLAAAFGEKWKALVELGGQPMLTRVTQTLIKMPDINRIVILSQEPEALAAAVPPDPKISFATSGPGISSSIAAIAGTNIAPWPLLITTADHPLLSPEMIRHFLAASVECDVAVGMVERATLLAAYPNNRRTWLRFRDGAWSGANLFTLNTTNAMAALTLWAEAERDRKQVLKLFWHFGPWLALRAATRTIRLDDALRRAGQRLGLVAKLVPLPFAEASIDVDKVSDHVLAEKILMGKAKVR
jgi:GTP:adenosylcobinamide-phosphate guanylyltransferase